jgi:acyl-CoA synthetase (AMP-forming)/AMP-acid ligase II
LEPTLTDPNRDPNRPSPQASPFSDFVVFNNIKQKLGGRVRLILSGAAPLSPAVQEFLAVAMCAPVLQVRARCIRSKWGKRARERETRLPPAFDASKRPHPSLRPRLTRATSPVFDRSTHPPPAPQPQGYGLTETCAATCIAEPFTWSANGTVGPPLPGVEVRRAAGRCGGSG